MSEMTIEERLKCLILARYKSVRSFSIAAGIPYTTVDSMLKRGVLNASIGTAIKVCSFLGISADGLADGEIVPYEKSDIKLNDDEREMIQKYRMLDERGRQAVRDTIEREYSYTVPLTEESASVTGAG